MNHFTRRLVYSSIAFAVSGLSAIALPLGGLSGSEIATADYRALRTTDSVPFAGDITQSGFPDGEKNTQASQEDTPSVKPSAAKVVAFGDTSRPVGNHIDPTAADSLAPTSSVTTTGTDTQPVSDAVTNSDSSGGSSFNPITVTALPEPSSMLMAGSVFFGWGLFLLARRKRSTIAAR